MVLILSIFAALVIALVMIVCHCYHYKLLNTRSATKLPPSPAGARPFLGHLHLLQCPVHRTLHNLSLKHGPIFSLRLGSNLAVVASSWATIQECFTKNDLIFANRPHSIFHRCFGYNYTTLISSSYGKHWINLRRLCSLEIFSPARLNMHLSFREEEVKHLLCSLHRMSMCNRVEFFQVQLRSKLCELTFNNIMSMVAGKRSYGDVGIGNEDEANRFKQLVSAALKLSGPSNAGDYLPFLRWIDYKGIEKNISIISRKMDNFLQSLINQRHSCNSDNTMIDHLLSLQQSQPEYYTDDIIKGLLLVTLIGGTNTSETAIEWAMSLLVNHPEVMKKARDEIDSQVGFERLVKEEDLSKLPYLNSIVLETFRLFPPLPLLLPHKSSEDCKLGGYDVPHGTIILANAWAIHRDPELWDEPNCFKPERFGGKEFDAPKMLLPFGMGRRVCPGAALGQRVVGLTLASLIQSFEWENINGQKVDMDEGMGLAMPRANPLVVMCKPRPRMNKLFKNLI